MPAPTERLRLYVRPDCGLCEDTALELRRRGVPYDEVNIEDDAALEAAYGELIPVLCRGDEELARAPIDRQKLEDALQPPSHS